jgi:acetylornithine deacetylase/succinyl-diaminopimelate desuccinylase-like protein
VKVGVVSLLEAEQELLRQGYQPTRSLLFAFGHDEEVGGSLGAGERQWLSGTVWQLDKLFLLWTA